jgi:hypothetical protein
MATLQMAWERDTPGAEAEGDLESPVTPSAGEVVTLTVTEDAIGGEETARVVAALVTASREAELGTTEAVDAMADKVDGTSPVIPCKED